MRKYGSGNIRREIRNIRRGLICRMYIKRYRESRQKAKCLRHFIARPSLSNGSISCRDANSSIQTLNQPKIGAATVWHPRRRRRYVSKYQASNCVGGIGEAEAARRSHCGNCAIKPYGGWHSAGKAAVK